MWTVGGVCCTKLLLRCTSPDVAEGLRDLHTNSFVFDKYSKDREFARLRYNEQEKTNKAVRNPSRKKSTHVCPAWRPGLSSGQPKKNWWKKCNPGCSALFQYPNKNLQDTDRWYNKQPLDKNALGDLMKKISSLANTSRHLHQSLYPGYINTHPPSRSSKPYKYPGSIGSQILGFTFVVCIRAWPRASVWHVEHFA